MENVGRDEAEEVKAAKELKDAIVTDRGWRTKDMSEFVWHGTGRKDTNTSKSSSR